MPYTNVNIFQEKREKVWEPVIFIKKWVKKNGSKNHSRPFCCHLIQS
jgi:hypothetical protein